jgi:hypothetical protein
MATLPQSFITGIGQEGFAADRLPFSGRETVV